ncbi:MAG: hypothetical protein JSU68_05550 [Phycisphaerales bacterium]|nr:MAG: hypothetical protein JSU68_05550 [Phycisphaerales bacterium]
MCDTELSRGLPPTRGSAKLRFSWPDAVFVLLLAAFWVTCVTPIVVQERRHGGDIFRDAASAANIAQGRFLTDPAYPGETIWYPPLSPAIFGLLSRLFDSAPLDCYRWSQLLFNWTIPAGLYLIVRLWWGWRAAALAVAALLLAIPWWQCEVVQGQPSVHAVVWGMAALLLYARQECSASAGWATVCGTLQGVAFWHHPLIPSVLSLTFVVQAMWSLRKARRSADVPSRVRGVLVRNALILGLTLLLAAPMLYLMLHGPVLNTTPREFIAGELRTVEFALMRLNPWIWVTGLIGVVLCIKRANLASRLVVCVLGICAVGQLAAYPRIMGWPWAARLPLVVPHELQWTFQLAWAVCVAIGIDALIGGLLGLRPFAPHRGRLALPTLLLALLLTGTWGLFSVKGNLRRFVHVYGQNFPGATAWIRANTDIGDVFACEPIWAYAWLNPDTGRKVWLSEPGHSNPRVDWKERKRGLDEMAAAIKPETFWRLVREHDIDYCIPSTGWMPRVLADPALRREAIPAYLELVYGGGPEDAAILRVRAAPFDPAAPQQD